MFQRSLGVMGGTLLLVIVIVVERPLCIMLTTHTLIRLEMLSVGLPVANEPIPHLLHVVILMLC